MNHNQLQHLLYAAIAGICGSSAGLFGKIGMVVDKIFNKNQVIIVNIVRFLMIVLVILSNVGVWLMYTRSLQFGSTLISTGISIASNYIFTFVNSSSKRRFKQKLEALKFM
ncbi:uncharacterized protein LOC126900513 isoform X2 [Daktulosphaira vitifoliae]|uniref:uncharacterized protein LOC126900513 isoform X2 n=1 Tax=Daktulosphaira vitifoliae TaxID=58002 RepID=UPI0021AA03B8|nr:uncharacterized protein LOC126900513 isoform X2 [Daktulosphaira vitifoliae]